MGGTLMTPRNLPLASRRLRGEYPGVGVAGTGWGGRGRVVEALLNAGDRGEKRTMRGNPLFTRVDA